MCAEAGHSNGCEQQQNSENSETRQTLPRRFVVLLPVEVGDIHPDKFEEEIGECDEIHQDDDNHARNRLASDPPRSGEEETEGDEERSCREPCFDLGSVVDRDKELNGESEEEKEIELEECDINLGAKSVFFSRRSCGTCIPDM